MPVQGCPSYVVGMARVTLSIPTPNGGTRSATIWSSGTWSWLFDTGPMQARYNWPPGYWPTNDGSGVEVQVGSADGSCRGDPDGLVHVSFTKFYHVNSRYPRRRGSQYTGGDDGSGDTGCRTEYIVVEINYGDGTGWHELWEGWAQICG
jgi:hypothetical protein